MPVTFRVDDTDQGTDEGTWRAWRALAEQPELTWPAVECAVVVAPHPDDEVLGVGGTLRRLQQRGVDITVVAVTDGEACRPAATKPEQEQLRARRRAEVQAALARLDVPAAVVHLGLPDGAVGTREEELVASLTSILTATGAGWCLATWRGDGHPDHEAVGRAALRSGRAVGVEVGEYPVWAWHWSRPADPRVPWGRARRVALEAGTQAAKRRAIRAFASQLEPAPGPGGAPVLPPAVVARYLRPFEVLFV